MQTREQTVRRGKAGAALGDAIEACAWRKTAALAGFGTVCFEIGEEVPDQLAHMLLCGAVQISEGVQFMHQPFRHEHGPRAADRESSVGSSMTGCRTGLFNALYL
jgi:hypothetical protein